MITQEQIDAAKSGQAVEIEADDTKLILIRRDLLENYQRNLPPEVVTRIVDDNMEDYDADDPLLASYQKFK